MRPLVRLPSMIRHNANAPLDPAADAAMLLRRIGFATLALALPIASLVSRRAAVVLTPIGIALLIISSLIEERGRFGHNLKEFLLTRPGFVLIGLVGWAVLSLVWSPYTLSATEKATNLLLAVVLGFCGAAALPERMRAANLNLIALGTGIAALFALALTISGSLRSPATAAEVSSVDRGITVVLIMSWPALAWLLSRARGLSALGLALAVGLLALTRFEDGEAVAMICGAVAFGAISANRELAARIIGTLAAGLMLFAPALPFLLLPVAAQLPDNIARSLGIWADIVISEPVRLITGHGLDTVLRGRLTGILPTDVPATLLFELWYELGLVGAAGAAVCLFFAIRAAGEMVGALAAGVVAAYVTGFALAVLGFATFQTWWLMTLASVALLFTAVARGQYRTDRPLAPLTANPATNNRPKAPNGFSG